MLLFLLLLLLLLPRWHIGEECAVATVVLI